MHTVSFMPVKMADKVAVVTGSNKGIGYGIVKELCRRGVRIVYLTARDEKRGKEAVESLNREGFFPKFHQLEITSEESVKKLADHLRNEHSGLDILINNAAIITEDFCKTTYEDSKKVIGVNYFSVLVIQEYLFPILKDNARVVNISSDAGHISNITNPIWIEKLTKKNVKLDDINAFVNWFLENVKNETLNEEDFVETGFLAYRVSKIALCALTRVQQNEIGRGISINSLHPGFVKTNMTKNGGVLNVDEASKTPVYLALDVDQSLKGKYIWFDKSEKEWADPNLKVHAKFAAFKQQLEVSGYKF